MKKFLKVFFVLVVIVCVAVAIRLFVFNSKVQNNVGVPVSVQVSKQNISTTISATGSLEPVEQVEVGTQVSGDISKIYVDFNSKVKQGDIIAELDKSKLQATLNQAEIALNSAEIDYQYKESTYQRIKKLNELNSASAVDLEQAEYNRNTAKLALEKSKNEVEQAKLNLSYATIKSPINGVVLERAVDVGQTVAASMSTPTLFVIAKDLKQMKVMADVDEADIGAVKKGQKVTFTVDAFQNETFTGKVQEVRLNPTTTSNVVTYTVVINAQNPKLKLLPGMTATCTIVTKEVKDAISIPVKALKFSPAEGTPMMDPSSMPPPKKIEKSEDADNGPMPPPDMGGGPQGVAKGKKKSHLPKLSGDKVWININGKLALRPVKIGINDGVNVEILKGLSLEDSVVVSQEAEIVVETKKEDASSPFMPSPPGKKKKK